MTTTAIEHCIAFTQQEARSDIPRVVSKARKELRALTDAASEAERLRARVAELETRWLSCRQCGKPTEPARHCYATPVCFACLPPPAPLPVYEWQAPEDDGLED